MLFVNSTNLNVVLKSTKDVVYEYRKSGLKRSYHPLTFNTTHVIMLCMSETQIRKIEKEDIRVPYLENGNSAIVFQRHERYERDAQADNAGSLFPEGVQEAFDRDFLFFHDLLAQDTKDSETMVLFVSSDTQYANRGYRSLETAQIAEDAAISVMEAAGIDPSTRIINLNSDFKTDGFGPTGQTIRPDKNIREPQIFDNLDYVDFLKKKYGDKDGLTPKAWGAHEMDAEKEKREELGAEGVYDILDRTKKSIAIMERYAGVFHSNNPNKKLLIWVASHYDTISPLVKDATGTSFEEFVPVDYGAGVVIELGKNSEPILSAQGEKVTLNLGKNALKDRS